MGLCESLPTEWVARQTTSVMMDLNLSVPDGGGVRPMESGLERHPLANVRFRKDLYFAFPVTYYTYYTLNVQNQNMVRPFPSPIHSVS